MAQLSKQIDAFASAQQAMDGELQEIERNIANPQAAMKKQKEELAKDQRDANRLLHFNQTIEELENRQRQNHATVDQLTSDLDVLRGRQA